MIANSISQVLDSVLQYMALIFALILYLWVRDVFQFPSSTRVTSNFKPCHRFPKSRSTRALTHDELFILYQWIRRLRKKHNLTQEEMADKFGVAPRTVQRWENGTRPRPHHYSMFQELSYPEMSNGTRRTVRKKKRSRGRVLHSDLYMPRGLQFLICSFYILILAVVLLLLYLALHFWLHII